MDSILHPYEKIPLVWGGLAIAAYCLAAHGWMLWKPAHAQGVLKKLPRDHQVGVYTLAVGFFWFWLLIAPQGLGIFSKLEMDLGEFNGAKPILRIITPVAFLAIIMNVREFLFVRAIGVLAILAAAPLLESAFQKEPTTRLLVPIFAYAMLTKGLFFVGMPYVFRDAVSWASASNSRWQILSLAGLFYGILTLFFSLSSWQGY